MLNQLAAQQQVQLSAMLNLKVVQPLALE